MRASNRRTLRPLFFALAALTFALAPVAGVPAATQSPKDGKPKADSSASSDRTGGAPQAADVPSPETIDWKPGPAKMTIGMDLAEIDVPEGYLYADAKQTQRLLEMWENPIAGNEVGAITPVDENETWVLLFTYDGDGHVDDADRGELDAGDLLDSLKEGNAEGNKMRAARGWAPLDLIGWQKEPFYDARTNNLTWATIVEVKGEGRNVNHNIRMLGRVGVMSAEVLCSPETYADSVAKADTLLASYAFKPGNRYADFVSGTDKVAEYGLATLITGGAVAVAAKSGLLAKFWKLIVVAAVAAGAGIKKLFGRGSSQG